MKRSSAPVSYTHLDVYKRQERIETDILNNFKRLGVAARTLDGKERLFQLHAVFHMDEDVYKRQALIIDCGKEVSNLERRMAELAAGDTAGRRTDHTRSTAAPER